MLGEGALFLHHVAYTLDAIRGRLTDFGARFFESERNAAPYEELAGHAQQMDALAEELSAEIGPDHEAVAALAGARTAVGDILAALGVLRESARQASLDLEKVVDQTLEQFEATRDSFDACRDRYLAAVRHAREGSG